MKIRQFTWKHLRRPSDSGKGPVEYPETFLKELNEQCGRIIFIASLIATFAWLPYISIDRQLHPGEPLIVALRIGFSLVGLTVLVLQSFKIFHRYNLLFLLLISAYLEIATGMITGLTKADPVYLGGYLLVLTVLALGPIPRRWAWTILAVSILVFFTTGFAKEMHFNSAGLRYSLNDLLLTVLVAAFFIYLLDRIRFNSWEKSRKIEQQNKALRESEARYRIFFEQAAVGVAEIEHFTGRFLTANRRLCELLGRTEEELRDTTFQAITHPDDLHLHVEKAEQLLAGTIGHYTLEKRYISKDGDAIWVNITVSNPRETCGTRGRNIVIVEDIAERKRAEAQVKKANEELAAANKNLFTSNKEFEAANEKLIAANLELSITEKALRESEDRLRTIIDGTQALLASVDLNGHFTYANEAMAEAIGYKRSEEVIGKSYLHFIHPEDRKRVLNTFINQIDTRQASKTQEFRIIDTAGGVTWVSFLSTLVVKDGQVVGQTGVAQNITERILAGEALRRSEEQYRLLAENCDDVIFTLDPDLRFTYISPSSFKLRGLTAEEAMQEKLAETMNPASLNRVLAEYRRLLPEIEQGRNPSVRMELELYRKDGSTVWVESSIRPMRDSERSLIGYLGVNRDISERKKTEDALRESENKYRFLIENCNDIVWTFDLKKMAYSFCSQSVTPILGYSSEESEGMTLDDIFSPKTKKAISTAFGKIIGGAATTDRILIEAEHIAKDRRKVWMEINAVVQKDQTGKPSMINGISRDITERKRVEAVLQASKDAADAANRSKSIFLANMSHEIRTPMNAILGFAQLMQREQDLSPKSREHLGIINRSGEHLLSLINDILEMSKIEAGRATFSPITFDLHSLLNDLEKMFRVRTDAKNLRFLMEKVGDVPRWVITDAGKLRQILINLLGNAVKFTTEGGISLRICAKAGKTDTLNLKFEVEDTGPGMAEEEIGRLFQAFEQAGAGIASGGTGLGLALSQGFVQIMGGSIAVTSTPGKGTKFRFEIPVQEGMEEQAPTQEVKRRVLRLSPGQGEIRVLVADDRETNRQLLSQLLEVVGFTTREAVNGAEALRMVHEWKPRAVLMDMTMPVMDGYEATRHIKESDAIKDTGVIAVTASAFEDDKQRILAAGADGYLSKPFKDEELFQTIGRLTGVEYLYEEASGVETALEAADVMTLMRKTVAALPSTLVSRIRDAVESADLDLLNEIAGQLVADHPTLALRVKEMAARYEYDALIALFSPGE